MGTMMRRLLFCLVMLLMPMQLCAEDLGEIVVVGPAWERFTNRDGTGLYHEILQRIFTEQGISLKRLYVPSQRGNDLVRAGRADMMTCRDRAVSPLFLARYPMYEGSFHVFFNTKRCGPWAGVESLANHSVVFRLGYYSSKNFPSSVVMKQVKTAQAALGMVLLGRADYYVDDLSLIKESLEQNHIPFDRSEYTIREAGWRQYYPVLLNSSRGRKIEAMYAQGMRSLHESGELQVIFNKWGFPYPHYAFAP